MDYVTLRPDTVTVTAVHAAHRVCVLESSSFTYEVSSLA